MLVKKDSNNKMGVKEQGEERGGTDDWNAFIAKRRRNGCEDRSCCVGGAFPWWWQARYRAFFFAVLCLRVK